MYDMSTAFSGRQRDKSALKFLQFLNMLNIFSTLETFHFETSPLNVLADWKRPFMFVTEDVSHRFKFWLKLDA